MKKVICFFISMMLIFTIGCGKKSAESVNQAPAAPQVTSFTMDKGKAVEMKDANTISKKIIECEMYIVADDLYKTSEEIEKKAKEMGGYIENQELNEYNSNTSVRVPSNNLEVFISFIEKSYDLKTKRITSKDITDEYVDNDARLKNLKTEEAQIQEIMKKAGTVEDILKVQSELYRIRGEIESLEARKKNWDKQVDYSMVRINADKKQIARENKISIISGSDFGKALSKGFINSFIYFVLLLQKLCIFLISNMIYLLLLGIAGYFILKKYRKIKNVDFKR